MKKCLFDNFTKRYEISKTLRFELKPVKETRSLMETNKVFEKDKKVLENYHKVKNYFDKYHQFFIEESLKLSNINFNDFFDAYKKYKNDKKDNSIQAKKDFNKIKKDYRQNICLLFDKKAKELSIIYKQKLNINIDDNKDFLKKEKIFSILKDHFKNEECVDIFSLFKGLTTYFTGYYMNRDNFYEDNGITSAVATRIIDENLIKFLDNIELYCSYKTILNLTHEETEIFEISNYNKSLLQKDIDFYNVKIGDINKKINLYNQNIDKTTDKQEPKVKFFKKLYNQILGKNLIEGNKFIEIKTNKEVFDVIREFDKYNSDNIKIINSLFDRLFDQEINNKNEDLDIKNIFIAKRFLNTISNKWFQNWNILDNIICNYLKCENHKISDTKMKKLKKKDIPDFISLFTLKEILNSSIDISSKDLFKNDYDNIIHDQQDKYIIFLKIFHYEFKNNIKLYQDNSEKIYKMIEGDKEFSNKKIKNNEGKYEEYQKKNIKEFLDVSLSIYQMAKYFLLEKDKEIIVEDYQERDSNFYNVLENILKDCKFFDYYAEFRNFLTKKPFNEDKIKLNFDNGQLMNGWDVNKEKDFDGILLRKDNKYYLGILVDNKIFNKNVLKNTKIDHGDIYYEKMFYKFLPDCKKMLPKVCFSKSFSNDYFVPDKNIIDIYTKGLFKKDNSKFSINALHELIDFYKKVLNKYEGWQMYSFKHLKNTEDYKNIGEFFKDIEKSSYMVWFEKISEQYINENISKGKMYLFEIYNKDFSNKSKGNKNLHTLYWQNIFSENNLKNPIFKLNGGAEIFFRPNSVGILEKEEIITKEQKKKIVVPNKSIYHNQRYLENKILFHCPITINFACHNDRAKDLNTEINKLISNNKEICILGIDRGEKNLIYCSVIDQKGNIKEIDSLNIINDVDYLDKLNKIEKERMSSRKDWAIIENIKEMKEGYLSQVINLLVKKVIEYNAIIIFEDLSGGFKRGRQKIEREIYQKLELALINKLSYLVDKEEKDLYKVGGVLNGLQLTPLIKNYNEVGKQTGIIFYTQAGYTSKTCPECGFRKSIKFDYLNIPKSINKLKMINFDIVFKKGYFEINFFDDVQYDLKHKKENIKKQFCLNTRDAIRYKWHRNLSKNKLYSGETEEKDSRSQLGSTIKYDINECFAGLFKDYHMNINQDIKKQIFDKEQKLDADFYRRLFYYLELLMSIRNSISNTNVDYIKCPCCNFDSQKDKIQNFVWNGDANGAYNIARKGLMILEKIKNFQKSNDLNNLKYDDFVVNIKDWDNFVQK